MKGKLPLRDYVTELCLECHPNGKNPSEHVTDVVPSMVVEELPLTEGRMTCITCHDEHKNTYRGMLRVRLGELCRTCHQY
jgi:predicted CXXCH cytochrome family protein